MSKTKKIVVAGLLLAILIVLSRFLSIKTPLLVISFSYVPIILAAVLLGPAWSMAIAGLGDLIGALLFPFGTYFVGYTISQALTGIIFGLLLYKTKSDEDFFIKLMMSAGIVLVFIHAGLTTAWVMITSGKAFMLVIPTRLASAWIMLPVEVGTMYFLKKALEKPINKYLMEEGKEI